MKALRFDVSPSLSRLLAHVSNDSAPVANPSKPTRGGRVNHATTSYGSSGRAVSFRLNFPCVSSRTRLAAPPGAGMAVSLWNRVRSPAQNRSHRTLPSGRQWVAMRLLRSFLHSFLAVPLRGSLSHPLPIGPSLSLSQLPAWPALQCPFLNDPEPSSTTRNRVCSVRRRPKPSDVGPLMSKGWTRVSDGFVLRVVNDRLARGKGKGTSLNSTSLTPKPLVSSVYVPVSEAIFPCEQSISVTSHFPSLAVIETLNPASVRATST